MTARLPWAAALVGSILRTEAYRRFASPSEPLRCAASESSSNCFGVEYPTASFVFSSRKPQRSIGLPIVSVLDIETRCSIKLHIDNWTGKFDFIDRA